MRISNFKPISNDLAIGGQPAEPYFPLLRKAGFGLIIHIEMAGISSMVEREDLLVLEHEMLYEKISIDYNNPQAEDFIYLGQLLEQYQKLRIFVHCTAGYCTSALIIPYLMHKYGWSLSETLESVHNWSIPPHWGKALEEAISATV